jgi:hypothetical protein
MRQRRRRALALAVGVCALAIPSAASAAPRIDPPASGYSTHSVSAGSNDSSQAAGGSGYVSPDSIVAVSESKPVGSSDSLAGSGYRSPDSIVAVSGPPADTTFVSSPPNSSDDGFDWVSALLGAGAALALSALAAAALLTVRRRTTITPSPSTS